jgi:hypothetical protein
MKVMDHLVDAVLINLEAVNEAGAAEDIRNTFGFGSESLCVVCVCLDLRIAQITAILLESEV